VVEDAEDHHVRVRIDRADLLNESGFDHCLLVTLHLGRARRRLESPGERLVASLGVEVIRDDVEALAVEDELRGEGLAARVPRGVRRVDATRAERELCGTAGVRHRRRGGRVSAGPAHARETAAGPEWEDPPALPAR